MRTSQFHLSGDFDPYEFTMLFSSKHVPYNLFHNRNLNSTYIIAFVCKISMQFRFLLLIEIKISWIVIWLMLLHKIEWLLILRFLLLIVFKISVVDCFYSVTIGYVTPFKDSFDSAVEVPNHNLPSLKLQMLRWLC